MDGRLDEADISQLAALGYVVTEGTRAIPEGLGPDPYELIPLMTRLLWLVSDGDAYRRLQGWRRLMAFLTGNAPPNSEAELIREFEKLAAEHPDFAPVYQYLARAYRLTGRDADAERAHERLQDLIRFTPSSN